MNERNQAFDATKGFLIILVIMGHVLLGSISENLGREVIYFFHMPIFLAITGYFTKRTLINKSIAEILLKYKYRMILPFIYAFAFYTTLALIRIHISEGLEIKHFTYRILYPFYHLWYVPAVIIFAFYTKSLERIGCKTSALIVSCFFFLTIIFEGLEPNISDSIWYESLGDKRFYYFFYILLLWLLPFIKKVIFKQRHRCLSISCRNHPVWLFYKRLVGWSRQDSSQH